MKINYFYDPKSEIPEVARIEPEKIIVPNTGKGYHQCYAHKWANLNRFFIRSYFDLHFSFILNKKSNECKIVLNDKFTENLYKNEILKIKPTDLVDSHKPVFQILLSMVFYSKQTCFLEVIHPENLNSNLKLIRGKFDISSWVRPISIALEVQNLNKDVIIKRNDILAEVAFHTERINEPIILEKNNNPSDRLIRLSEGNSMASGYLANTKRLIGNGRKLLKSIL